MSGLRSYFYYEDTVITPATRRYRVYHADEADKYFVEQKEQLRAELEKSNRRVAALIGLHSSLKRLVVSGFFSGVTKQLVEDLLKEIDIDNI